MPKRKKVINWYGVRVPDDVSMALQKVKESGKALNESDYIRDAIRRALREDGLL